MTATLTEPAVQRVSWRVAPSGAYAVCTMLRADAAPALEVRDARGRTVLNVPGLGPMSQLVPGDDAILVCHHRGGRHLIEQISFDGVITPLAASDAQGLALIDAAAAIEFDGTSRVMRIEGGQLREVARLSGPATGATRLDACRLAIDVAAPSGHCSAVEVDLSTGAVAPFVEVSPRSDDRVLDFVRSTNLLVISTDATGHVRLGVGHPGEAPVRFPAALAGPGNAIYLGTDGVLLAVAFDTGARSALRVVDLSTDTALALELPPLVVLGRGALHDGELIVPVSTPDRAATLLRVDTTTLAWSFDDRPAASVPMCGVRQFGAIEAVVVGDLEQARSVVIALHGGPLDAWRASFDPLLAALANAGIAVVAPNIRGSVGYGRDHALAIAGAWGGPDLDDVLAVADHVAALRGRADRPALLGLSYGAWLALLAAQRDPQRWSACVALAPFLSGSRVAAANGPVAELVHRLRGITSPDLRDELAATTARVLVVHGAEDDVVPVAESLELDHHLRRHGHRAIVRIVPGVGHDLLTSRVGADVLAQVVAFLELADG